MKRVLEAGGILLPLKDCRKLATTNKIPWKSLGKPFYDTVLRDVEPLRRAPKAKIVIRTVEDLLAMLEWGCVLRVNANVKYRPYLFHPFFRHGGCPQVEEGVLFAARRKRLLRVTRTYRTDTDNSQTKVREYGLNDTDD